MVSPAAIRTAWPIAVQQAEGPVLRIRKSRAPPTILDDMGPLGTPARSNGLPPRGPLVVHDCEPLVVVGTFVVVEDPIDTYGLGVVHDGAL